MKHLNVALIGCGVISDNHIIPILECECAELVALCDIDISRAESKARQHGISPALYSDYVRMLDTEKLDVVHIATPHYLHAEMTLEALRRGINVFLEKPMCINRDDIEKLIEAERASTARVCVCFQNRFNPATIYAKDIIDKDGGAVTAYGALFWKRDKAYYESDAWRGMSATEGGGVMINQAIHTIDLLCFFLGKPEKVCATTANHSLKGVIDVEDSCEGVIYYEDGKQANFYATNSFRGFDSNTVVVMTKNHRVEVSRSHLYVDDVRIDDADNNIPNIGKACYGSGHGDVIKSFYSSILLGTEPPITLESAQYALRVLLAAYDSHDEDTLI